MKTFDDLQFKPHRMADLMRENDDIELYAEMAESTQAKLTFKNGWTVSVLFGRAFFSNGIDTYEVAVLNPHGSMDYLYTGGDDVAGNQSPEEVTAIMKRVQVI